MPRLAIIQMRVNPGDQPGNLARAAALIQEAALGGAGIALLPEALDFGWSDSSALQSAGKIPGGESFRALSSAAASSSIYVCAGLVERAGERLFNSAVLLDRHGKCLLVHRKINELEFAHSLYAQGDRLGVAQTEFGRIGLMICADAFFRGQAISRALGAMGAKLILSPCAWAVAAGHDNVREPYGKLWFDNYGPPAREFGMWIAGASSVGPIKDGPWAGRVCIGASLVVGPDGQIKVQAQYGTDAQTIAVLDIPPGDLAGPCRPRGETTGG